MKFILPTIILALTLLVTAALVILRPDAEMSEPQPYIPAVNTLTVDPESVTISVRAQGTAQPRMETTLTAEVGGRIVFISDIFQNGSFFEEDQLLLEFDPLPYEAELSRARSTLAAARMNLFQEQAQAEQAREEWLRSGINRPEGASPLVLREPQIALAQAEIEAAKAAVATARRNLERTQVRAPYNGRVRERSVSLGQVATASGTVLGQIYSIDRFEVRIPLSLREYTLLGLHERTGDFSSDPLAVNLRSQSGDLQQEWQGKLVRSEGSLDPRNRMIHVVVEVDDPYRRSGNDSPVLQAGRFLTANISGPVVDGAFRIPRSAIIHPNQVRIIDADNRLRSRQIQIHQTTADYAIITGGLEPGDRISLTAVDYFVEGMEVSP